MAEWFIVLMFWSVDTGTLEKRIMGGNFFTQEDCQQHLTYDLHRFRSQYENGEAVCVRAPAKPQSLVRKEFEQREKKLLDQIKENTK